jgi:DNA-binding beta-propeller fold protein YncE
MALALSPTGASAAQVHGFSTSFGEPGTGAGQLDLLSPNYKGESKDGGSGLAVNDQSGDVYVADTLNNRVSEFTSAGAFVRSWGWGVLDGSPELQSCTSTSTCQAGSFGNEPGQFAEPLFVAVDNGVASPSRGDVYVGGVGRQARNERQEISFGGGSGHFGGITGGTYTLTFEGQTTAPIPYDARAATVEGALEALSTIDAGNIEVGEVREFSLLFTFQGSLKELDVPQLELDSSGILPDGAAMKIRTLIDGSALAPEFITKFDSAGNLIEGWGSEGQLSAANTPGHPLAAANGITVDGSGNLLLLGESRIFEFDQADAFAREILGTPGSPGGIAVDGSGSIYYTSSLTDVQKLDSAGISVGAVTRPPGSRGVAITGLAVSPSTDTIYADQEGSSIAQVPAGCRPESHALAPSCIPTEVFGEEEFHRAAGLAVDSTTGTVYGASTEDDRVFAFALTLEATTQAATAVTATTATLDGTVDPIAGPVVRCRFQYGTTTAYGTEVPCLNSSNEEVGTTTHPITTTTALHADISGLAGGSKYHYRLRVSNARPEYLSSEDEELLTKTLATIEEASASEITAGSATLNAKINPNGLAGEYRFEYGPCSSPSACTSSPFPGRAPETDKAIGSGTSPVSESQPIVGLAPDTTYHFRVVATDANGSATSPEHTFVFLTESTVQTGCPNEALRAENDSTLLPDCRAYELVTPMDKNGSLIGAPFLNTSPPQVALDGTRVIAPAIQCFADSGSCVGTRFAEGEPFQFERGGSGWQTTTLALPASVFHTSSAWLFNADTGAALFGSPSSPNGQDDWYVREGGTGSLSNLGPASEEQVEAPQPTVTTADFSHVVWLSPGKLWSFDQSQQISLYAYPGPEGSTSEPQLVAVSGGPGSHDLIGRCGSPVAGHETYAQTFGSLSADGRTTYFQVRACPEGSGSINEHLEVPVIEIYARIDGEGPAARTVAISQPRAPQAPQANPACTTPRCLADTDPAKPQNFRDAEFTGASEDGRLAYFLSPQQLTDEASQDPNAADTTFAGGCSHTTGANGCNLYLYENPQQQPLTGTHLFAVSTGDSSGLGPEVQGMFALSTDGTHAYFVAKGVLTEEPNSQGEAAGEGADNLYLYERDGAHPEGRTRFVTRLTASLPQWEKGLAVANTTPDGRYLVFESGLGLTADARPSGPTQIYRYDAQTGRLQRLSFGLGGFNADGNAGGAGAGAGASIVPLSSTTVFRAGPARSDPTMSDDGSVVFFQSPVALVPGALDEVELGEGFLAQNVYEWEEQGHGGCSEPRGCISLISDGRDTAKKPKTVPSVTELLGTDASGENVFFATASQLNWADTDTQRDYYDARVGGGFPQPPESQVCSGDACKGQGTAAGEQAAPATPNVNGPGNVKPTTKCKKGQVRKGGKCVKRSKAGRHRKGRRHRQGHKKRDGAGKGRSDRSQGSGR